nr:hypothetical protein Itr_chr10CG08470 [Ipomoea trifida]
MASVVVLSIGQIFFTVIDLAHGIVRGVRRSRSDSFTGTRQRLFCRIQHGTAKIQRESLIIFHDTDRLVVVVVKVLFFQLFLASPPQFRPRIRFYYRFGHKPGAIPFPSSRIP